MNYFLSYDNACPLFVGGHHHGQKRPVPSDRRYWNMHVKAPRGSICDYDLRRGYEDFSIQTECYRAEWVLAEVRRFRILVHDALTPSAAFMLMMSTVGEHPDLVQRVKELEAENKALKRLLQMAKF